MSTLGCVAAGLLAAADGGLVAGARAEAARAGAAEVLAFMTSSGVTDGHLVKWIGDDAVDEGGELIVTANVGLDGKGAPALGADTIGDALKVRELAAGDCDVGARLGEEKGGGFADTAAAPGDEGDLAFERKAG